MTPDRRCPRCRHAGFKATIGFNRPRFVCDCCEHTWTKGHDGGGYFELAQNTKGRTVAEFREFTPEPKP